MTTTTYCGYVICENGLILVQTPDDNQWGFTIHSDDQSWPGGFSIGSWTAIRDDDPRISDLDRESLGWIIDSHRSQSRADA